ncbi:MAG: GLPGLI family protein [Bacteroidaceae bacterium]|nr:GLPGLI family protein [Bacteroidaceae bacterium]
MKNILMTMMALTLTIAALGQTETVDTAQFVAVYDYECRTMDDESKPVTDRMQVVVQVGRTVTKSMPLSCYEQGDIWKRDKLASAYQEALMHIPTVWTGWPEGQATVREFIFPHEFEGCEPTPDIAWTLTDDTLAIGGYSCQRATATFRGVAWTAWYAEETPSSAGPWRLRGLPGLIVKAESEAHTFCLAELKDEASPITAPDSNPEVQRMNYAKLLKYRNGIYGNRQYIKNPTYYVPDLQSSLNDVFVYNHGDEQLVFANGGHPLLTKVHEYRTLEAAIGQLGDSVVTDEDIAGVASRDDRGTDTAQFVVAYDWVTRTTNKDGQATTDSVRLAVIVAGHTAKCMEYNRAMMEDFGETSNKDYQFGEWNARQYNLPVIYVGFPEGKISVFDKIVPNRYFYTEPLPDFHWQLADDTLTVGCNLCHKAVGRYAGRTWTAWYAEDVPAPYGPWKLRGLPGMILMAEDADGIFRFDLAGLEQKSARINFRDRDGYTTMKRDKFVHQRNKLLCNKRYVQNPRYYIPDGAYDHLNIIEMWPGGPEPAAEDKVSVVATDMIIPKKVNAYQPLELR